MGDWCYLTSIVPNDTSMGIIDAIDIEDPTSPTVVDEGATPPSPLFKSAKHGETWVLSVSGDATYKYLTSMKVGYVEPNLLTKYIEYHSIVYPDTERQISPSQLKTRGNWAAVVDSSGMHWINVSDPTSPLGNWGSGWFSRNATCYGIDVSGNSIFVTSSAYSDASRGGLWVLDGETPGSPPSWTAHASPDDGEYEGHHGNIGEVEVDGNVAYVFGMDDLIYIDHLFLDSYDIFDYSAIPPIIAALDAEKAICGSGGSPGYLWNRMGVIEVVGDTIYGSVRMVPYKPFPGIATSSMDDKHIHLFNATTPSGLGAFLGTGDHNIGYSQDGDDIAGDFDVEGDIIYSLISPHHGEGRPIERDTCGLVIISYDLSNSSGPILRVDPPWNNSEELDWDFLWSGPREDDSNNGPHPLDLLIDGDYGFASAGDLDFYPREGLWLIDVADATDMGEWKIRYFEPTLHGKECRAKVNGMDIAGDYLYAVGTVSEYSLYEHRFWSIKVYQRNHSTGGLAKRVADTNPLPVDFTFDAYPNPFNSSVELRVSLTVNARISVIIVDLTGRKVATIADGEYSAGTHSLDWKANNNSSGIYFVIAKTEDKSCTRKLLLIR